MVLIVALLMSILPHQVSKSLGKSNVQEAHATQHLLQVLKSEELLGVKSIQEAAEKVVQMHGSNIADDQQSL